MTSMVVGRRAGWAALAALAALLPLAAGLTPGGVAAACDVTNEATLRAADADVAGLLIAGSLVALLLRWPGGRVLASHTLPVASRSPPASGLPHLVG